MGYVLKEVNAHRIGVRQTAAIVMDSSASGVPTSFGEAFPAGTILHAVETEVITAFNAGSTNVLIAGNAGNDDAYQDSGDITEGTPGLYTDNVSGGTGVRLTAAATGQVTYTGSGTAPTTGKSVTYFHYTVVPAP